MRGNQSTSVLREDIRRIMTSKRFYLTLIAGLTLILRPLFDISRYWSKYSPMELLSIPLGLSDFTPFAVVFCVLPFAESFCEDLNSGYHSHIILRKGSRRYAAQRCISVALSGGMVMSSIMAITIVFCLCAAKQSVMIEDLSFMNNTMWARTGILQIWNGNLLYLIRVFVAFIFGCVWALVGLTISIFIPNRYVTLIAPFVLYQFLWFLLGELPINPVYMFRGDSNFIPSFGFLLVYQSIVILICFATSYYGIRKRVRI